MEDNKTEVRIANGKWDGMFSPLLKQKQRQSATTMKNLEIYMRQSSQFDRIAASVKYAIVNDPKFAQSEQYKRIMQELMDILPDRATFLI